MPEQPRSERRTQNRVISLFTDKTRPTASATAILATGTIARTTAHRKGTAAGQPETARLFRRAYFRALQKLETAADATGITLYQANLRTYQLLRYGVQVQIAAGQATKRCISWIGSPREK